MCLVEDQEQQLAYIVMARERKKKVAVLLIDDETGGRQDYVPSYFKFEQKVQRVSKKPQK